jgi:hypothetical protein
MVLETGLDDTVLIDLECQLQGLGVPLSAENTPAVTISETDGFRPLNHHLYSRFRSAFQFRPPIAGRTFIPCPHTTVCRNDRPDRNRFCLIVSGNTIRLGVQPFRGQIL